ncbi:MAG: hypothetical protein ACK5HR_04355 [Mycoplasmatales bacterium]
MKYILTDVNNIIGINEENYQVIEKNELTKSQIGEKIRNLMKINEIDSIIKEIEI